MSHYRSSIEGFAAGRRRPW